MSESVSWMPTQRRHQSVSDEGKSNKIILYEEKITRMTDLAVFFPTLMSLARYKLHSIKRIQKHGVAANGLKWTR